MKEDSKIFDSKLVRQHNNQNTDGALSRWTAETLQKESKALDSKVAEKNHNESSRSSLSQWMARKLQTESDIVDAKTLKKECSVDQMTSQKRQLEQLPAGVRSRRNNPQDDDDAIECGRRGFNEETKPGAFAIGGTLGDDDEFTFSHERNDEDIPRSEIHAENVDDEVLALQYRENARQTIHKKIHDETPHAEEVTTPSTNTNGRKRHWVFGGLVALFVVATGVAIAAVILSKKPKDKSRSISPTNTPLVTPSPILTSDLEYVQEQLMLNSVSEDSLLNTSSAQYKALNWLVYEDPVNLNVRDTSIMTTLIDRYALAVIYFSTNGQFWSNNGLFLSNSSACDWSFVDCNPLGEVNTVVFIDNDLSGTIPAELAVMTSLETIHFSGNNLYGTIPSSLGQLRYLEKLVITFSSLSGTIPSSLTSLTNLEIIDLQSNKLTGRIPEGITKLPLLEALQLNFNLFDGTIPEFANQISLELIAMWDNLLHGEIPKSITLLPNLEVIQLSENDLTGTIPSEIGLLHNLETLWIFSTNLSGTLPTTIGNLEFLEILGLFDNRLNGTIPTELGRMYDLANAWLFNNEFTGTLPSEIGEMSKLKYFGLGVNLLSGTVPTSISQMTSLEFFGITNTSISDDSLDTFLCKRGNETQHVIKYLEADCRGKNPEVPCACCTKCCDDSGYCDDNQYQICNNYGRFVESNLLQHSAVCNCGATDTQKLTCFYNNGRNNNDSTCQTCNKDSTVCGETTSFGFRFSDIFVPVQWFSSFKYQTMERQNTLVNWEWTWDAIDCKVSLDGQECLSCNRVSCADGYVGKRIDCSNILLLQGGVNDGPVTYDSCFPQTGGVLDVFYWMDSLSWTGCPFLTYEFGLSP